MEPVGGSVSPRADAAGRRSHDSAARSPHGQLPVLDARGRYRGVITARAVADALADGAHDDALVSGHVDLPQTVRADQHLDDALDVLETARGGVPVLDADGGRRSPAGSPTRPSSPPCCRPPRRDGGPAAQPAAASAGAT